MKDTPMNVGIVGCGSASILYLEGCRQFDTLRVVACADLVYERARARAAEFNVPGVSNVEELLNNPEVEVVLNLTDPSAHTAVGMVTLESGKHLYQEKPLAVELNDALSLLETAAEKGLRVGCAPDTFMGRGQQTCRKLIDEGAIGEPLACAVFMMCHGHEDWHPSPDSFYRRGGGPMFDMGPYYLTALINLFGPIRRVTASAKVAPRERVVTGPVGYGRKIKAEVPTHVAGVIDFVSGVVGTIVTSFDVWASELPSIEVYGTEGTLSAPDPNNYCGPIRLYSARSRRWVEVPPAAGFAGEGRGVGLAEMADALGRGRPHRANGGLAYHVLESMHGFHLASLDNRHVEIASTCGRPEPLREASGEGCFA